VYKSYHTQCKDKHWERPIENNFGKVNHFCQVSGTCGGKIAVGEQEDH